MINAKNVITCISMLCTFLHWSKSKLLNTKWNNIQSIFCLKEFNSLWICFLNKNNLHRKAMYQGNCKILPYKNTIFYSKQIKSWIEKAWEHGQWYDSSRSINNKKKKDMHKSKLNFCWPKYWLKTKNIEIYLTNYNEFGW